ncbi:hypothetical protein OSTOST_17074 [Ostertagia ostertagi]
MAERLSSCFRYHHYFHSGFTGSGVCVFSRYPIVSTLTHRYSLNGFAHHIHRGDWFGGKVVGLVEIEIGEIRVNFYATHLHAEYNRRSQSFELSQFVRHTAHGADVVIVVGDFNMEPEDLGFSQCRGVAHGGTCDRPDNCYTEQKFRENDESKRIDYILFKGHIPDENLNYSDHVGVQATFKIASGERELACEWEPNRPLLIEAIGMVSAGGTAASTVPTERAWFTLTVVMAFCLWYGVIGLTLERKALKAAKQSMRQLLND